MTCINNGLLQVSIRRDFSPIPDSSREQAGCIYEKIKGIKPNVWNLTKCKHRIGLLSTLVAMEILGSKTKFSNTTLYGKQLVSCAFCSGGLHAERNCHQIQYDCVRTWFSYFKFKKGRKKHERCEQSQKSRHTCMTMQHKKFSLRKGDKYYK